MHTPITDTPSRIEVRTVTPHEVSNYASRPQYAKSGTAFLRGLGQRAD
jgi:hypothetical protein